MATIAANNAQQSGAQNLTVTDLTGTDDFLTKAGVTQILVLNNTGSGTPTVNIDGPQGTTVNRNGLGDPIDVSGGYDISLTATGSAGAVQFVRLSTISAYTQSTNNTVAVTGGTADVEAYILEL